MKERRIKLDPVEIDQELVIEMALQYVNDEEPVRCGVCRCPDSFEEQEDGSLKCTVCDSVLVKEE